MSGDETSTALEAHLRASRAHLVAFIRTRVSDPSLADDVLQESVLKALRAAPSLSDVDKLAPWFRQIVRNTLNDLYRRQQREARGQQQYARAVESDPDPGEDTEICRCFEPLMPTLKPEYRELISELDLKGAPPHDVARRLGITMNNLKVRRHRARQQLKQRLEETCRVCAAHGCLDCTCLENAPERPQV